MKQILTIAFAISFCLAGAAMAQVQTEDSVHTSGDTGSMCLSVRSATAAALAGAAGDYQPLITDGSGQLYVTGTVTAGATSIGKAEDVGRADADTGVPAYAVRDDALVANQENGTDLDYGPIRTDNFGALWTHPTIKTTTLTDTAVVEAAAYASGDCIMASAESLTGTAATAPFLTGRITDVVVTDLAAQAANMDLVIFNADPGAICGSINSAADIADDDLAKVVAVIPITTHFALNDNSVSVATNSNVKYSLASGTTMYYALISRGTPTYGGTSDLVVSIKVELD